MTNGKTTRRALFSSIVALMLCFSMLLGTTFAWFTDSAVSGNNIIKTGNLDMKLSYKPYGASNTTWTEVKDDSVIFGKDALYEPGYTEAVWLKVDNLGTLAFRYDLAINVANEKQGTNKAGEKFSLSDYLDVKYMTTTSTDMESNFYTTRESLDSFNFGGVANSGVTSFKDDIAVIKNGVAYSINDTENGDYSSAYVLVVISMPETVDNEANHNGTDIPEINFTLTAVATQLAYEKDSFGSDYDTDSEYPEVADPIASFNDLKAAMRNGGSYMLTSDFTITANDAFFYGDYITAIYNDTVLDLNGHTITVDAGKGDILFYVYAEGASLTVKGNGSVIAKNDAFIFFPRSVSEGLYIYGGNYYNNDDSSGTQNDMNAIVYTQLNNNIHIYGGTFTFKNVGSCGGFNVYDNSGGEIILYEGVLLSNPNYYKGSDGNEIHLAEGCVLKEVVIDGATWYQVTAE